MRLWEPDRPGGRLLVNVRVGGFIPARKKADSFDRVTAAD